MDDLMSKNRNDRRILSHCGLSGLRVPSHGSTLQDYDEMGNAIEIQSQVMRRNADAGEYLLGMAQRRLRNRTWWNGKIDADQPWEPEAGGFWVFHQGRRGSLGGSRACEGGSGIAPWKQRVSPASQLILQDGQRDTGII